jgi:hypothetical protein
MVTALRSVGVPIPGVTTVTVGGPLVAGLLAPAALQRPSVIRSAALNAVTGRTDTAASGGAGESTE